MLFYAIFSNPVVLLLPLPFSAAVLAAYLYSPKGYCIQNGNVHVRRRIGNTKGLKIVQIKSIRFPSAIPAGLTFCLLGVGGVFGSFGLYWNRYWGIWKSYVTDPSNSLELITEYGEHLILSPDEPELFIEAIKQVKDVTVLSKYPQQ